jgi:hypothetical protein
MQFPKGGKLIKKGESNAPAPVLDVQSTGPPDGRRPLTGVTGSHEPRPGDASSATRPDAPLPADQVARLAEFVAILDGWDRRLGVISERRAAA